MAVVITKMMRMITMVMPIDGSGDNNNLERVPHIPSNIDALTNLCHKLLKEQAQAQTRGAVKHVDGVNVD